MTPNPDERLTSLEHDVVSLKDGVERIEKAVEKLADSVSVLMDKLDARYPSKESVDLRFESIEQENQVLKTVIGDLKLEVSKVSAWMYKIIGAMGFITVALDIVWYLRHW